MNTIFFKGRLYKLVQIAPNPEFITIKSLVRYKLVDKKGNKNREIQELNRKIASIYRLLTSDYLKYTSNCFL